MGEKIDFLNSEQARDVDTLLSAEATYKEVRRTAHPEIAAQFWRQIKHRMMEDTGMSDVEFESLSLTAYAFRQELDSLTGVNDD